MPDDQAPTLSETGTSDEEKGTSQEPFRIAKGPRGKKSSRKKKQPKPADTPPPTQHLYILFYLPMHLAVDDWVKFLDFPWTGQATDPGPFSLRFTIIVRTQSSKALDDLKEALATPGALIAYMSHTALGAKGATGLKPQLKKRKMLKNAALVRLLEGATANVVVLAGCATSACVPKKLGNDIIVVTTDSGRDGVTNSATWGQAIAAFLMALLGEHFDNTTVTNRGSVANIQEAINESNPFFPSGDKFVLSSGDGTFIV